MRTIKLVALTFVVGACATSPESFTVTTPQPAADAFSCALRELNQMGFTVDGADRDAGFLRGSKKTSNLGTVLLAGKNYWDHLTISVFEAGEGRNTIRVTAAQTNQQAFGFTGNKDEGNKPSDSGRAAARDLLTKCGNGAPINQQIGGVFFSTFSVSAD